MSAHYHFEWKEGGAGGQNLKWSGVHYGGRQWVLSYFAVEMKIVIFLSFSESDRDDT